LLLGRVGGVFICRSQDLAYSFLVDIWFRRQLLALLFEISWVLKLLQVIFVLLLLTSWINGRLSFLVVGRRLVEDDGVILVFIWLDV
jgi:hypothetical protein